MKKSVKIYMVIGNRKPIFLEECTSKEIAELRIKEYERVDRYEVEVLKYGMPIYGYPVYIIK